MAVMTKIESLLADYLNYLEIEKNRSPKTRENYEHYLRVFIRESKVKAPADITDAAVRNFRIWLARPMKGGAVGGARKDLKKATQAYYVIAIRSFLKYLAKRDIPALAAEKIELPRTPDRQIDVLDYRDLERLVTASNGTDLRSLRDRAVLETLFSTGLRLRELCMLDRYLDLDRGELSVRGKGDKLRVVFLSDRAKGTIRAYLAKRTDTDPALFVSLSKGSKLQASGFRFRVLGRITPRAVERLVAYWAVKAGVPKRVHPHQLRHAFATDLLLNGADLRSVQELLGHANVSTTQIYTHITNKELREVHKAFHGRRRK